MRKFFHMNPQLYIKLFFVALFVLISSCQNTSTKTSEEEIVSTDMPIVLTKEQEKIAGIELGVLEMRLTADIVECTGIIDVPPTNKGSVYAQIGGVINKINVVPGSKVRKGQILAILTHREIILLQEDFLESKSKYIYWEEEYSRKKSLEEKDAVSRKSFLETQTEYYTAKNRYESLREQLKLIGIIEDDIVKNGITSEIVIKSPLNGFVSEVFINIGMYVNINTPLFEVLDIGHVHLELFVFSNDINKIKFGQPVKFQFSGSEKVYWAEIRIIGKKVEDENRSVLVHAFITDKYSEVTIGNSVLAQILTQPDSAYCLPEESVITHGSESFIFVKETDGFRKKLIKTGRSYENYIEIRNPGELLNKQIIIKGAYYLED